MCSYRLGWLATIAFGVLACSPVFAQVAGSTPGVGIDQRAVEQQQRIQNGVQSGALTSGETRRLESRESSVARQEQRMRARDNGALTARDHQILTNRQNAVSNGIYQNKHNANRAF
jgi:hypothetical protein